MPALRPALPARKIDTRRSFERSQRLLERAERVIPLGAQTFSKSRIQFPPGAAPLFVTHGDGGKVYDVDGNEYVDLMSALLPNVLGYRDPDVDLAIRRQLTRGISFSLATEVETALGRAADQAHPVRRDGALRQERHRCDLGGGAARARRDAARPAHAVRLSRLAGLVHRRDHAQSRRAGECLRALAHGGLWRPRGGRCAVQAASRRVRRDHPGAGGRH